MWVLCSTAKARLLIIDGIHQLLTCTSRDQRAALHTLEVFSNEVRVSIAALVTNEDVHAMRTDLQSASLLYDVELPPLTASQECRSLVAVVGGQLGEDAAAIADDVVAAEYLQDVSAGLTLRSVEVIRLAARNALRRDRRKLTLEELQGAGREMLGDLSSVGVAFMSVIQTH